MSPSRSAALVRHELRVMLADTESLIILTAMPLLMIAFFKPVARLALVGDNPKANGSEFTVPGMTTMFAFFLVGFIGFSFFAERQWNTWERLRASPASNAEILVGKVVPAIVLSLFQQTVLFSAGYVLFGMRIRGSVLGLAVVSLALTICLVSVGVLCAALFRTQQQLNAISNLGAMILAGISGALVPLSVLPAWARTVAPIAPQYWAMRGFRSTILDGGGVSSVLLPVGVLLAVAAVAAGIALLRFRFDDVDVDVSSAA
ncbi:MAG TPA: ABC transporter permease [Acidimicrobiales bacterium]|nr:ABC transporter permease [Acidimicrobiales bacterium]